MADHKQGTDGGHPPQQEEGGWATGLAESRKESFPQNRSLVGLFYITHINVARSKCSCFWAVRVISATLCFLNCKGFFFFFF